MNKAKRATDMPIRLIFTLLLSTFFIGVQGQLVYFEDFGTATVCSDIDTVETSGVNTVWRIYLDGTNSQDTTNRWFISSRESNEGLGNCSDGCLGSGTFDQTLHISTNSGSIDPKATYDQDSLANVFVYAPTVNINNSNGDVRVEFDYLEGGDGTNDNATFVVTVGNNFLTPTYGTFDLPKTNLGSCSNGEWKHYVLYLNTTANSQTQMNFGFHWVNNGDGSGSDPSIAIDNFKVIESVPLTQIGASDTAICDSSSVFFSDSTLGNPTAWNWQFGSGQIPATSTAQNPGNVMFPSAGTYVVTLTTTNLNGSSSTTKTITVQNCFPPSPAFIASDYTLCQGQCINYFDNSTPGTYGTGGWIWQFQGGTPSTSTDKNPQNICYSATGIYNVTLTVTDTVSGEIATSVFTQAISVGTCQVPVAAFITDTTVICNNDFIEFYSIATGNPDSIKWEFGSNANPSILIDTFSNVDTVQVLFPTPGNYTITMTVWNGAGIDDTVGVFQVITVKNCPRPIPKFTVSSRVICPGVTVVFEDLSNYATEWEWEFPGGVPSVSVEQHPEIRYDSAGKYPVVLTVKNVNGDSTRIQAEYIEVDSCLPPDPRFEIERDSICKGTCVQFFNTSLRADSIFWIFWWHPYPERDDTIYTKNLAGDTTDTFVVAKDYFPMFVTDSIIDTIFMEQDPIYCFNDSGVVGVQLFAFNEHDVAIENSQDVAVLSIGGAHPELSPGPDKYVRIDNIKSQFYLDDTVKFEPKGTGPHFSWSPQEGLSCYDCPTPIIHPTTTRKYFMTNYDDYGCQVFDSVIVFVENSYYAGIPNIFSPNGDNNNDVLWVRGNGIADDGFVMRIWNRYGELVFESYDQNKGWNGNFKGAPSPMGAYTYFVKVTFLDGTVDEMKGNVTIVRY